MLVAHFEDLSDLWVEGRPEARWRSTVGTAPSGGAQASSSVLLEIDPGCTLPRHTDSAEEIVVVVSGEAEVDVAGERAAVPAGGVALVPRDVPHRVASVGDGPLRFVAVYAGTDVVTRYEDVVQPSGERELPADG